MNSRAGRSHHVLSSFLVHRLHPLRCHHHHHRHHLDNPYQLHLHRGWTLKLACSHLQTTYLINILTRAADDYKCCVCTFSRLNQETNGIKATISVPCCRSIGRKAWDELSTSTFLNLLHPSDTLAKSRWRTLQRHATLGSLAYRQNSMTRSSPS